MTAKHPLHPLRKPADRNGLIEVSLIFACDMVKDNDAVLQRALADILSANPGELIGAPEIALAPRAGTCTLTIVVLVSHRRDALQFQQRGERILERYGLRSAR